MHYLESLLTKALLNVEQTETSHVYHLEGYHNLEHLKHMGANLKVILVLHLSIFELKPDWMNFLRVYPCFIAVLYVFKAHFSNFLTLMNNSPNLKFKFLV